MKLNKDQIEEVLRTAVLYVNYPYSKDFSCVDFVRKVYSSIGIEIPKLKPYIPPEEFNITKEELNNPPAGHIIFFKDRTDSRKYRAWTHIGIIMPNHYCIHCSLFFGKKVIISSLSDMYKKYDFAESEKIKGGVNGRK